MNKETTGYDWQGIEAEAVAAALRSNRKHSSLCWGVAEAVRPHLPAGLQGWLIYPTKGATASDAAKADYARRVVRTVRSMIDPSAPYTPQQAAQALASLQAVGLRCRPGL